MSIFAGKDPIWTARRGAVSAGLVGHWDSMALSAADRMGNIWYDISGNNNHGTLTNGASFERIGMGFDGTNDVIVCNSLTQGNLGVSDATICLWAKLENSSVFRTLIAKRSNSPNYAQYNFSQGNVTTSGGTTAGKYIGMFWYRGGSLNDTTNNQCFRTTNDVVDGNWHHIVFRRINGTTPVFFIDGVSVAVTAIVNGINNINADQTTDPITIGSSVTSGSGDNVNGQLDDIRLYNRALSNAEILRNFNATRARFGV